MRVTLFMAMSANGMIASEGGSEDFLADDHWRTFAALAGEHGNFIVGRKTYEAVRDWPNGFGFDDFPDARKIVMSGDAGYAVPAGYRVAASPAVALRDLEGAGFTKALVTGGAGTNASFLKAGLIDEVILNLEPALVGKGMPLLTPLPLEIRMALESSEALGNDIVQLRYRLRA